MTNYGVLYLNASMLDKRETLDTSTMMVQRSNERSKGDKDVNEEIKSANAGV